MFDLFGRKARKHAQRLSTALQVLEQDVLNGTDFGMKVSNPDHPFHESITEARRAVDAWDNFKGEL